MWLLELTQTATTLSVSEGRNAEFYLIFNACQDGRLL